MSRRCAPPPSGNETGVLLDVLLEAGVVARRLLDVRMTGGRRHYRLGEDAAPCRTFEVLREDLIGRPAAILRRGVVRPLADGQRHRRAVPRRLGGNRRRDR